MNTTKHTILCSIFAFLMGLNANSQGVEYSGVKLIDSDDRTDVFTLPEGSALINDTELTLSDGWESERLLPRRLGRFCNTRTTCRTDGATAFYRFSNTDFISWHGAGVQGTSAEVFIDGNSCGTIDCSEASKDGALFSSGKLERGPHTFEIVAKTPGVEIDFIEYGKSDTSSWTIDSGNGSFVYHTPGFTLEPATSDRPVSSLSSSAEGEMFEVYFKGSSIRCYGDKGPDGGSLELFVKGRKIKDLRAGRVSLKSSRKASGALLFSIDGLETDGFNMIRGVVSGKKGKVSLGWFEIEDPTCLMVEMNIQTDIELAQMARHERKASSPDTWSPVAYGAVAPVRGVTLGESLMRTVFERNVRYLHDCLGKPNWVNEKDNDRIWIDMLYASNEGRMLGGMGNTLRFAENPEFDKAIEDILEGIDRRQYANGNGYLMPYGHETYNISTDTWPGIMRDEQKNYDRAMLTKGMLAAGMAGHERGYSLLRNFYDWFNRSEQYLPNMLLGSMGIQGSIAGPMVYHSPIGVPADIQTNMKYYDMEWWLKALGDRIPEAAWRFTLNRPHNYLLTSICALFDIYRATGEEKYLNAALGGWDIYHDYFQIPGGGISLCEHFECRPWTYNLKNLPNNIYETCGSVFWTDLNHRFLQMWPEKEEYAAEIEKAMYNIVIPAQGEDGTVRYFNQFNEGKYPPLCFNTCCEIQATAYYGMMPQYIYSQAEDGVYVNLFSASEYSFSLDGKKISLTMDTRFPDSQDVAIMVGTDSPVRMKLRVRIPSWAGGKVKVDIDGKTAATALPGSYLTLDREWKDGETVSFTLPMSLRKEKYIGSTRIEGSQRYAILYGPILMAVTGPMMSEVFQAPNEYSIKFDMSSDEFMKRLKPTAEPCVFEIEGQPGYTLRPYYSFHWGGFTCFPGLSD